MNSKSIEFEKAKFQYFCRIEVNYLVDTVLKNPKTQLFQRSDIIERTWNKFLQSEQEAQIYIFEMIQL